MKKKYYLTFYTKEEYQKWKKGPYGFNAKAVLISWPALIIYVRIES